MIKQLGLWLVCAAWIMGEANALPAEMLVVRGEEDYPPLEMHIDGKLTGLHVEMVNAVARQLGIKVQWKSLPWKRAQQLVKTGDADALTYIAKTAERMQWAIFLDGNVISKYELRFIINREDARAIIFDGDIAVLLQHHPLIGLRGYSYRIARLDQATKIELSSMEQLLGMLHSRQGLVGVVNWTHLRGAFLHRSEMQWIMPLEPPVAVNAAYIAFSRARNDQELAEQFAAKMLLFKKSPAYDHLLKTFRMPRPEE